MRRYRALLVFLGTLFLYNVNLRSIPAGDTVGSSLLPFSIVLDGSLNLDRFKSWLAREHPNGWHIYREVNDHVYSMYPVALPLAVSPLYLPYRWAGAAEWNQEALVRASVWMEKVAASFIAAIAVLLFFLLARRLASPNAALALTAILVAATPTWSAASQALWQHGASEVAIIATLLALNSTDWRSPTRQAFVAGMCAGLAFAFRPTNVCLVLACVVAAWLGGWNLRRLAWLALGTAIPVVLVLAYNMAVFGDPRGGYQYGSFTLSLHRVAGVLVSPSRGLLVFCPQFILAGAGIYWWMKGGARQHRLLYSTCLIFSGSLILLISFWWSWWGGWSYGPRLLTDLSPSLVLLLLPSLEWFQGRRLRQAVLVTSVGAAMVIQAIGAFCYPRGNWNGAPVSVDQAPERLWEWRDNQILRTARAGPDLAPYRRLLSKLAGSSSTRESR